MLVATKALVLGLVLETTGGHFTPRTKAEIGRTILQGAVYKINGDPVGTFESAQIVVKGGIVHFRDPASGQIYAIPKELIVVIVPAKKESLMRSKR